MLVRRSDNGDTLIEVMFAFALLSLIIVGSLAIMNQGSAAAQRSLETTLVRQQVDAQAEALRFLHDSFVTSYETDGTYDVATPAGQWNAMVASINQTAARSASNFNDQSTTCAQPPGGSFIINTRTLKFLGGTDFRFTPAVTSAQTVYDAGNVMTNSQGLWIEGIRSIASSDTNEQNAGYIDFHIRSCWDAVGSSVPTRIATIVRLYEPRG